MRLGDRWLSWSNRWSSKPDDRGLIPGTQVKSQMQGCGLQTIAPTVRWE